MKKILSVLMSLVMVMSLLCSFGITAFAAQVTVSLPYQTLTVTKGKTVTVTPTVKGTSKYTLVWGSSDKDTVSVTSSGKITGKKSGSATVTVKVKGTDAKASVKVTVGTKVTAVTVPDTSISLKAGESYTVKASITPSNASNKKVTFATSAKGVAAVTSKGVITAVKEGTAKITVKAADGSGKKAVITVNVTAKGSSDKPAKPSSNEKVTNGFDKDITAMELVKKLKVGWNLGNSLDALGSGANSETSWGNPKTSQKMIDAVQAAGFNTIRIPTSWGKHADDNGKIDREWMARVKEVVDYAYNNGMYVILNSHHDNAYYDIGGCVKSASTYKKNKAKMEKLWTNIANEFKDYDEHLIFEALNEPRTEGSAKEWVGGTPEEREIVDGLNSAIVSAIRKTGGNNAYRLIMVPAYAATSSTNILRQMKLPDDDRIAVSVHAYSPYNFAMNERGSADFTDSDKKELDKFFKELNDIFVSKGTPVIIGECGVINKDNLSDRVEWASYFIGGAKKYNIPCCLWDNNSKKSQTGSETFGYFNRLSCKWNFPEIVEAAVKAAK